MQTLGFIGLGIMGAPMAGHLIKAGHTVQGITRSRIPAALLEAGGLACAGASEVAQRADVIFTMPFDTPDVDAVLFGPDGVAAGLSAGKTVADMKLHLAHGHQGVREKGSMRWAAPMPMRRYPAARSAPRRPA